MPRKKAARAAFPQVAFRDSGRRPTPAQLTEFQELLVVPDLCVDFIAWHNGGTPKTGDFDWQSSRGKNRTSTIDMLFGIDSAHPLGSSHRRLDIAWAVLKFHHWLPRWSVPLGMTSDDWFLITFSTYDDARAGQVWLKEWQHDIPDDRADRDKHIHFVAESCASFASLWYSAEDPE